MINFNQLINSADPKTLQSFSEHCRRGRGASSPAERYFLGSGGACAGGLSPLERCLPQQHLPSPGPDLRHTRMPRGLRVQNCSGAERSHGLNQSFPVIKYFDMYCSKCNKFILFFHTKNFKYKVHLTNIVSNLLAERYTLI